MANFLENLLAKLTGNQLMPPPQPVDKLMPQPGLPNVGNLKLPADFLNASNPNFPSPGTPPMPSVTGDPFKDNPLPQPKPSAQGTPYDPTGVPSLPDNSLLDTLKKALSPSGITQGIGNAVTGAVKGAQSLSSPIASAVFNPQTSTGEVNPLGTFVQRALGQMPVGEVLNNVGSLLGSGVTDQFSTGGASGTGKDPYTPLIDHATQQLTMYSNMAQTSPQNAAKYKPLTDQLVESIQKNMKNRDDWNANNLRFGQATFGSDAQKSAIDTGQETERLKEKQLALLKVVNDPTIQGADKLQQIRSLSESINTDIKLLEGLKRVPAGSDDAFMQSSPLQSVAGWLGRNGEIVPEKVQGTLNALNKTTGIMDNNYKTMVRQFQATPEQAMRYNKYYEPEDATNTVNADIEKGKTDMAANHNLNTQLESAAIDAATAGGKQGVKQFAAGAGGALKEGLDTVKKVINKPSQDDYDRAVTAKKNGRATQKALDTIKAFEGK